VSLITGTPPPPAALNPAEPGKKGLKEKLDKADGQGQVGQGKVTTTC